MTRCATLMLAGWYLMIPPSTTYYRLDEQAPLSQWVIVQSYDTAAECRQASAKLKTAAGSNYWGKAFVTDSPKPTPAPSEQDAFQELINRFDSLLDSSITVSQCIATDDPRLKSD